MAKYVEKITKKERERKQNEQESKEIGHYSETTGPNELKFCLELDFDHRMPHITFQPKST